MSLELKRSAHSDLTGYRARSLFQKCINFDKMRASSTIENAVFGSKYTEQGQDA